MLLYLIIFLIPVIAYMVGPTENRNKQFLQFYMLALMVFVGLADMLGGYDRYIYGEVFDRLADGVTNGDEIMTLNEFKHFEIGYSTLSWFIALITENRYIYIFIVTMLIYFFIYKAFERSMNNYPLAMIIFLGMVFYFTFTYLRQVLAFSIAWYGVRFMIDKKWIKFLLICAIVTLLHKAGIIFLGILFVPIRKWSPNIVVFLLLICAIVGLSGVTGNMYDAYAEVSEMQLKNSYDTDSGLRIAYILEVAFFTWLILTNYNKIEPTRKNLIFLNMAWCFCAILLLFVKSEDGGRVAWFFTLGIIYIISLICTYTQYSANLTAIQSTVKNQKFMNFLIIVLMMGLYLRVYISWQPYNNLYPYKTFLTDGFRSPDFAREHYEYDYTYDLDKFYRPAFRFLE